MEKKPLSGNKRSKKEMENEPNGKSPNEDQDQTPNKKRKISSPNRKMMAFKMPQKRETEQQNKDNDKPTNTPKIKTPGTATKGDKKKKQVQRYQVHQPP